MRTIIAAGDSFTWGNDLTDAVYPNTYSRSTWAATVAHFHGMRYECVAEAGCSNQSIARRTIVKAQQMLDAGQEIAVLVMWTYPHRMEIVPKRHTFMTVSHWHGLDFDDKMSHWKDVTEGEREHFQREHAKDKELGLAEISRSYEKVLSEETYFFETLRNQMLLRLFLEKNKIPYVFTWAADNCITDNMKSSNPYIEAFKSMIEDANWTKNIRQGFVEWANQRGYPIGSTKHPLEEAHTAFAQEFVIPLFSELIKEH